MRNTIAVLVLVMACSWASEASARRLTAVRVWTDASGGFTTRAEFVRVDGERVVLRLADSGREIQVGTADLSPADQAYVALAKRFRFTSSENSTVVWLPTDSPTGHLLAFAVVTFDGQPPDHGFFNIDGAPAELKAEASMGTVSIRPSETPGGIDVQFASPGKRAYTVDLTASVGDWAQTLRIDVKAVPVVRGATAKDLIDQHGFPTEKKPLQDGSEAWTFAKWPGLTVVMQDSTVAGFATCGYVLRFSSDTNAPTPPWLQLYREGLYGRGR